MGVQINVLYQFLIYRTIGTLYNIGRTNGIDIYGIKGACGVLSQMQTVHGKRPLSYIQIPDSDPVFCNFIFFIPVLYAQPFSLMNGSENVTVNSIHVKIPCVI